MNKLTPEQMERKAIMMRVRNEASILRFAWLNEVGPAIEAEIDRRINAGEKLNLEMPEVDLIAGEYIDSFFEINSQQEERPRLGQ